MVSRENDRLVFAGNQFPGRFIGWPLKLTHPFFLLYDEEERSRGKDIVRRRSRIFSKAGRDSVAGLDRRLAMPLCTAGGDASAIHVSPFVSFRHFRSPSSCFFRRAYSDCSI